MLLTRIELVIHPYQGCGMPLTYKSVVEVLGLEPRMTQSKCVVLPLHYTSIDCLVVPLGIEPSSMILQTIAMTTSAKAPNCLVENIGIEPIRLSACKANPGTLPIPHC